MKLAAIIVPLAFLVFPTFAIVVISLKSAICGEQPHTGSRLPTRFQVRKRLLLVVGYMTAFFSALGWATYVFTEDATVSALVGIPLIFTVVAVISVYRQVQGMPKRPSDGFQDDKARLEWENQMADVKIEFFRKTLPFWKLWIAAILLLGAATVVVGIIYVATS